jgi:uncharacterized protein (TIGR02996 family)
MDHARAFLEAIHEQPDDDTPRLVFADWLDEHGGAQERARAAFIRAQVRAEPLDPHDPARWSLEDESRQLLAEHGSEWAAPLQGLADRWEYRRGFVEEVWATTEQLLSPGPRLMAAAPVRRLHLVFDGRGDAIASCPEMEWVEELDLKPHPDLRLSRFRDQDLIILLRSEHLSRLKTLTVNDSRLETRGVLALADSPLLAQLRQIDLSGNRAIGDRAARALAASPLADCLEVLRLSWTNVTPAGVEALFTTPHLPRLRVLDVFNPSPWWAAMEPLNALRRLLDWPLTTRLAYLDLGGLGLGKAGAEALAESWQLRALTELRLDRCRLQDQGAAALAGSPHLAGLTSLVLSNNDIGGPGIEALASSPHLARLRSLSLFGNFFGVDAARALASSVSLRGLTALYLGGVLLTPEALRILGTSETLKGLRVLHLESNQFGASAARVLADSPAFGRLEVLVLEANQIGRDGVLALAQSPHLRRLRRLSLFGNPITEAELDLLRARFGSAVVWK